MNQFDSEDADGKVRIMRARQLITDDEWDQIVDALRIATVATCGADTTKGRRREAPTEAIAYDRLRRKLMGTYYRGEGSNE